MSRGDHGGRVRSRSRSPRRGPGGGGWDRNRPQHAENKYVYLSNLPYELRWMELKSLVREHAGEVNFVELLEERNGRSKGCAIVEFTTIAGAKEGLAKLNGLSSNGRNIVAKDVRDPEAFFRKIKEDTGVDFISRTSGGRDGMGGGAGGGGPPRGGGPRRGRSPSPRGGMDGEFDLYGLSPGFLRQHQITPPLVPRVFVANIAFTVSAGSVFDMFSMAGKITYIDMPLDKEGKSKGMAVIEFSHPLEAVQAIAMFNKQKYFDRGLAVKMDRFDPKKPVPKGELPKGLSSIGMGLGANGAPLLDIASVISNIHEPQPQAPMAPVGGGYGGPPAQMGGGGYGNVGLGGPGGGVGGRMDAPYQQPQQQPPRGPYDGMGGGMMPPQGMGGMGGPQGGPPTQHLEPPHHMMGGGGGDVRGGGGGGPPTQPQGYGGQQNSGIYGGGPPGPVGAGRPPVNGSGMGGGGGGGYGGQQVAPSAVGGPPTQPPAREFGSNGPAYGSGPRNEFAAPRDGYGVAGGGAVPYVKKEEYPPAYAGGYGDARGGGGPAAGTFSSRVILIKNLPPDYTWQIVRDRSMNFGEVEQCELLQPGVARVRFSQNSEAERARGALAGTSVEGRAIMVDFVM